MNRYTRYVSCQFNYKYPPHKCPPHSSMNEGVTFCRDAALEKTFNECKVLRVNFNSPSALLSAVGFRLS